MELVLIRHGESEANRLNREGDPVFCGRWDCPLTERGIRQAAQLKSHPAVMRADAIYSSPLKRAVDTAKLFSDGEILLDSRLTERTMGVFDGRRVGEIVSDPTFSRFFSDPRYSDFRESFTTRAPNGENYTDVARRAAAFLRDVAKAGNAKVVVVSHMCTIRCLIREIKRLSERETFALKIVQCEPIVLGL